MANDGKMTPIAAARIQAHADKHGTNQGFKARAARAAANKGQGQPPQPKARVTPPTPRGAKR